MTLGVGASQLAAQEIELKVDIGNPAHAKEDWTPWSCNCGGPASCADATEDDLLQIDIDRCEDFPLACTQNCNFDDDDRHDPRTGIFFTEDGRRIALQIYPKEREGGFGGAFNRGGNGSDPGEYPDIDDVQARGDDSLGRDLWTVTGSNNLQGAIGLRFHELPAGTYALQVFHHDPDPVWNTTGNLPGLPRDDILSVDVSGNTVVESTGAQNVPQYTGLTDDELIATGGSVVLFTTTGASSDDGSTRIEIVYSNMQEDGVSMNGFVLRGQDCTGGEAGDTHVGGITVTAPAAGNVPGAYTVEATGVVDDSGDSGIIYSYEATNGSETVTLTSLLATEQLTIPNAGQWTFTVTADDLCPSLAADASASTEVILSCPETGDTVCNSITIQGPADNAIGEYLVTVDAADASGDDVTYTLTASRTGLDTPIVQQQVGVPIFTVLLSAGTWIVTVETDDDGCRDAPGLCVAPPFQVIAGDADFPGEPIRADVLFRRAEANFDLLAPGWDPFIPVGRGGPATTRVFDNIAFTPSYINSNLNNNSVRQDLGENKFLVMSDYFQPDNIFGGGFSVKINFLDPGTYTLQTFHQANRGTFVTQTEGDVFGANDGQIYQHANTLGGLNSEDERAAAWRDEFGLDADSSQEDFDDTEVDDEDFFFYCGLPGGTDTDGDGVADTVPEDWLTRGFLPEGTTPADIQAAVENNQCGRVDLTFSTSGTGEVVVKFLPVTGRIDFAGFTLTADELGPLAVLLPGDFNLDSQFDLSDGVNLLNFLFIGGQIKDCLLAEGGGLNETAIFLADANGDRTADISDASFMFTRLFLGGPAHVLGEECIEFRGSTCPTRFACR